MQQQSRYIRWRARRRLAVPAAVGMLTGLALSIPLGIIPVSFVGAGKEHPSAQQISIKLASGTEQQDSRSLYKAEQILIQDCMRRQGFRYWVTPYVNQESAQQKFPYVIDSVAWARRNGFSVSSQATRRLKADPNSRYYNSLQISRRGLYVVSLDGAQGTPGAQVALPQGFVLGHSADGCEAEAEGRLYGNYQAWFRAVNIADSLQPAWEAEVSNDPMYLLAVNRWARCMRASGYTYQSPYAAAAAFAQPSRHVLRRTEILAAVAEAACANSTGLSDTARQLMGKYAEVLRRDYHQEVEAYRQLRLNAIPRARSIINGGH